MFSFSSKVPSECGKCHFRDTNFKKFPKGACPPIPLSWTRLRRVRVPCLANRLATPVLIVNTPIVISSKRQVLPHFHTQKYVIFAWYLLSFVAKFWNKHPPSRNALGTPLAPTALNWVKVWRERKATKRIPLPSSNLKLSEAREACMRIHQSNTEVPHLTTYVYYIMSLILNTWQIHWYAKATILAKCPSNIKYTFYTYSLCGGQILVNYIIFIHFSLFSGGTLKLFSRFTVLTTCARGLYKQT